jgi:hypothetical protein
MKTGNLDRFVAAEELSKIEHKDFREYLKLITEHPDTYNSETYNKLFNEFKKENVNKEVKKSIENNKFGR